MKKTVQIVTIPLGKEGWDKDDLVIQHGDKVYWHLTRLGSGTSTEYVDAQAQQLLVLSDDEIENCDWYLDDTNQIRKNVVFDKEYWSTRKKYKAVLASYPQLPNTLPISKETVQTWIDSGTPREGSVELKKTIEKSIVNEWNEINTSYTDPQGNLLLEFGNPLNNLIEKNDYNWLPIDETIQELAVKSKPSLPTDYEILKKSLEHSNNLYNADDKSKDYALSENQLWENSLRDYEAGYKQALKDLGYM